MRERHDGQDPRDRGAVHHAASGRGLKLAFVASALLIACHDSAQPSIDASAPTAVHSASVEASVAAEAIPDAEADADVREMIEHALTLLEDAGEIVRTNFADCEAMGERMEEYRQKHLAEIAQVDVLYGTQYDAEFKRLQPQYRKRYKAAWAKISPGITKCRSVPKVKRVILEIWGDDVDASMGPIAPPP